MVRNVNSMKTKLTQTFFLISGHGGRSVGSQKLWTYQYN